MDVMEFPALCDVVVLETVLEEVKHLSMAAYTRLRALIANAARRFYVLLNEHHRYVRLRMLHSGGTRCSQLCDPRTKATVGLRQRPVR